MEIKLAAGDKIQVPANCKATIENGLIIIKDKREKFKNGDVLSLGGGDFGNTIVIFKEYEDDEFKTFSSHCNNKTKPKIIIVVGVQIDSITLRNMRNNFYFRF